MHCKNLTVICVLYFTVCGVLRAATYLCTRRYLSRASFLSSTAGHHSSVFTALRLPFFSYLSSAYHFSPLTASSSLFALYSSSSYFPFQSRQLFYPGESLDAAGVPPADTSCCVTDRLPTPSPARRSSPFYPALHLKSHRSLRALVLYN
jgi:hypothetical protein